MSNEGRKWGYILFGGPTLALLAAAFGAAFLQEAGIFVGETGTDGNSRARVTPYEGGDSFGAALTPTVAAAILSELQRETNRLQQPGNQERTKISEVTITISPGKTLFSEVQERVNSGAISFPCQWVESGKLWNDYRDLPNTYQYGDVFTLQCGGLNTSVGGLGSTTISPELRAPLSENTAPQIILPAQSAPERNVVLGDAPRSEGWYFVNVRLSESSQETRKLRAYYKQTRDGFKWTHLNVSPSLIVSVDE